MLKDANRVEWRVLFLIAVDCRVSFEEGSVSGDAEAIESVGPPFLQRNVVQISEGGIAV